MTSNVKLLPLPEDYDQNPAGNAEVQDYARACVAAKDAETEALRAEVDRLEDESQSRLEACGYAVTKMCAAEARAERLAEALLNVLPFTEHADYCGDHDAYNNAAVPTCGCGLDGIRERADALLHPTAAQEEGE